MNSGVKLGANTLLPTTRESREGLQPTDGYVRMRRFCGNFREHTKADSDSLGS